MKRWLHVLLLLGLAGAAQAQTTTILDRPTIDPSSLNSPENVYTLTDDANPSTPVTRKVPLRSVADLSRQFMTLTGATTLTGNEAYFLVVRHSNPAHTLAVPSNQSVMIYNGNAVGGTDLSVTGVGAGTSATLDPGEYAVYTWNGVDAHVLADRTPFAVDVIVNGVSLNPIANSSIKAYVDSSIPTIDAAMSDVSNNAVRNSTIKAYVDMLAAGDAALDYGSTNPIQNAVVSRSTLVRPYDVVVDSTNQASFGTIVSNMNSQGYGTIWIKGTVQLPSAFFTITAPISIRGLGPDSVLVYDTGTAILLGPTTFPIASGVADHTSHSGSPLSSDTAALSDTFTAPGLGAQVGDWVAVFSAVPWTDGPWHSLTSPGFPYEMVRVTRLLGGDQYHIDGFIADPMLTPANAVTLNSGTDTFTDTGHGLTNGTQVFLKATSVPGGAVVNTNYFVINAGTDDFQLSETSGGPLKDFSSNGSGVTYHLNSLRPKAWKVPIAKVPGQSASNVLISDLRIQSTTNSVDFSSFVFSNLDGLEVRNVVWEQVGSTEPYSRFTIRNCANVRIHHCRSDGGPVGDPGTKYWAIVEACNNVEIAHNVARRQSHMVTTGGNTRTVGGVDGRYGTPRGLVIRNNLAHVVQRTVANGGLGGAFDTHAEGWGVVIEDNIVVFDSIVGGSVNVGITNRSRYTTAKGNIIFGGNLCTGMRNQGANATFTENVIYGCTRGIEIGAMDGVYWGNCTLSKNQILGGSSFGGTAAIVSVGGDNNRYLGNIVRGYPGTALRVQGGDGTVASKNEFIDCNHASVPLVWFDATTDVSDNSVLTGNEFVNFRVPQASAASRVIEFLGAGNGQNIARNSFINCKVTSLVDIEDGTGHRLASNDAGKSINTNFLDANVNVASADITIVGNTLDGYGASSIGVIGTDATNINSASSGRNWTD